MRKNVAFTFIELIISITIFSIIAVSIYSVFRSGVKLWYKVSPMIQDNQSLRLFFNTVSLDLKNSIAYVKEDSGLIRSFGEDKKNVNFEGEKQKLSFYALVSGPGASANAELARVTYYYDRHKKSVRRAVATAREGLNEDEARAADILEGVEDKDFGFEYCYKLGSSKTDYDYEWKDEWADQEKKSGKIPRGVKVSAAGHSKIIFIPTGTLGGEDAF